MKLSYLLKLIVAKNLNGQVRNQQGGSETPLENVLDIVYNYWT